MNGILFRVSWQQIFVYLLLLYPLVTVKVADAEEASYLTVSVPGALGTFPMSINSSMTVTGYYTKSPTVAYGFVRDASGTITRFSPHGAVWTQPQSINDSGDIVGSYQLLAAAIPMAFCDMPTDS